MSACGKDAEAEREEAYVKDLNIIVKGMLGGAASAEKMYNTIASVWYDAIYEEINYETLEYVYDQENGFYDYSDALSNLYADENFAKEVSSLEETADAAETVMGALQDPPEKYEIAYGTVTEMYKEFTGMVNLVISPGGSSYNSLTEDFGEYDSDFLENYRLIKTQLPQIEEEASE